MFQKLVTIFLVGGLHISGCIGSLFSVPAAFATQIAATEAELPMTPAVFLCQQADDSATEMGQASTGCSDASECLAQSFSRLNDRTILQDWNLIDGFTPEALQPRYIEPPQYPILYARAGPLIALSDLPLHPFVQME